MRHLIRENIRVGVPITLEPGPDRIFPPKRVSIVYHGPGFANTLLYSGGKCRPLRESSRLSWGFIEVSSPRATIEGARRSLHSACTTKLHYGRRVYLADPQAPSSGRRKIEAAVECRGFTRQPPPQMHVGSSCTRRATMFRLHRGGRPPSHEPGTWRGKKSLTLEVNTALRFHSTHQATVPAIGGRMFFKSLIHI